MASTSQLISFDLEGRTYGIDVRIVKEINPLVSITPVPRSDSSIRGLVNIRGQVILVMDLAVIFGREPVNITSASQIIILKTTSELKNIRSDDESIKDLGLGDKPIGFVVDRIHDVIGIGEQDFEPVPPHLEPGNARFFDGVVRFGDELLMILNAREVLAGEGVAATR